MKKKWTVEKRVVLIVSGVVKVEGIDGVLGLVVTHGPQAQIPESGQNGSNEEKPPGQLLPIYAG